MRPRWTYEVTQGRKRHRRGYFYDCYELRRNDGKLIASGPDPELIEKIRVRFQAWAHQPWGR